MNDDILTIEQEIYTITVEQAGADGVAGKSAYEIAVDNGFSGSETDWLTALRGADGNDGNDGLSAYEIAVQGGFVGTEAQWLASLRGADGSDGNDGLNASISIGTTTTLPAGQNASVSNSGTSQNSILNFSIPRGADGQNGQAATISIGTTTTGDAGTQAQVSNSGTSQNAILNFTIPRGDTGASASSDPYDIGIQREIFSAGSLGYATFSLSYIGFSSSSLNGQDYSALTSQYVAGKEKYYGPNKLSFKSGNNPTNNDSIGFALNAHYNIFNGFTVTYACGLRTNADTNMAAFWGFTDLFVGLPSALTIFSSSSDNSAFGFGWDANDTNVQFVIKQQGTTACFKLNLNQFTGNLTASDILARQKEVIYIFRIVPKADHSGLDLYFKNGNTGNIGTYSLLFSNVPNMPSIYTKYYKPAFIINQSSGKTPDSFDFFRLTSRTY